MDINARGWDCQKTKQLSHAGKDLFALYNPPLISNIGLTNHTISMIHSNENWKRVYYYQRTKNKASYI